MPGWLDPSLPLGRSLDGRHDSMGQERHSKGIRRMDNCEVEGLSASLGL